MRVEIKPAAKPTEGRTHVWRLWLEGRQAAFGFAGSAEEARDAAHRAIAAREPSHPDILAVMLRAYPDDDPPFAPELPASWERAPRRPR